LGIIPDITVVDIENEEGENGRTVSTNKQLQVPQSIWMLKQEQKALMKLGTANHGDLRSTSNFGMEAGVAGNTQTQYQQRTLTGNLGMGLGGVGNTQTQYQQRSLLT
jgi:hypothetical protein